MKLTSHHCLMPTLRRHELYLHSPKQFHVMVFNYALDKFSLPTFLTAFSHLPGQTTVNGETPQ